MLYGKLINGVLKYAPKDYITTDQVVIENFNKNEKLLLDYGYKTVIDEKPNYNKDTQYLTLKCYAESDAYIICEYDVNDIPVEKPSTEEEIENLKVEIEILNEAVQELILSMMKAEVK